MGKPNIWKPVVYRAGKARSVARIFIARRGERVGYFPNIEAAEAECTKRNAAEDAAAQDDFEAGNAAWAASFAA